MEKWSLIIILGALVLMYVFLNLRQKRQAKKSQELLDSFKVGDKVITHIGIYGKIKRIYNTTYGKVCVLEIGTLNKIDIELDMRYIAGLDEKTAVAEEPKVLESKNQEKTEPAVGNEEKDLTKNNVENEEKIKEEKQEINKKSKNSKKRK